MADNIDDLDKLFKNALSNHSTSPAPEVWDKLSASLDKKNKGFLFTPWRWAAGVAVVLVSFWLFHHSFDVEVQKLLWLSRHQNIRKRSLQHFTNYRDCREGKSKKSNKKYNSGTNFKKQRVDS